MLYYNYSKGKNKTKTKSLDCSIKIRYNVVIILNKGGEKKVNEMPTDIQYKDQLRKELIEFELILEMLKSNNIEKAIELIQKHIDRINSSLQD